MKKIEKGILTVECNCDPDCVYNQYSVSMKEDIILERSNPAVYIGSTIGVYGNNSYGHYGTDVLEGLEYDNSYALNMGNISLTS